MSGCNEKAKILMRSGTNQSERFTKALDPDYFQLMDLEVADWILFAYNFAQHVHFFDKSNTTPEGNWQDFFNLFGITETKIYARNTRDYRKLKAQVEEVLENLKVTGKLTPHLTLFVSFLELLEISKSRFNKLTHRHLDFYYNEILGVYKKEATPDSVHIIFELAKKAVNEAIPEGTALNGKVDANNLQRHYLLDEEAGVNQAKVAQLKTVNHDVDTEELKVSPNAKTLDGLEEPLPEDQPFWLPFGYPSTETSFTSLPDAEVGFAIASPMLALAEGVRMVTLTLSFVKSTDVTIQLPSEEAIYESVFSVFASGAEKWLGDFGIQTAKYTAAGKDDIYDSLALTFVIGKEEKPVVPINHEIFTERFDTTYPVAQLKINMGKKDTDDVAIGYQMYNVLRQRKLAKIKVKVDVKEITSVYIENDNGVLKASKPFYPFTSQPIKASNFFIDYKEAFEKDWSEVNVQFDWKDTPEDFVDWYAAYKKSLAITRKITDKKSVILNANFEKQAAEKFTNNISQIIGVKEKSKSAIELAVQEKLSKVNSDSDAIVKSYNYFTTEKSIQNSNDWVTTSENHNLVSPKYDLEDGKAVFQGYCCSLGLSRQNSKIKPLGNPKGPIRLRLNNSLLHEVFPRLYAMALSATSGSVAIPNPPYTPIGENITLSYIAEEERVITNQTFNADNPQIQSGNTKEDFLNERIQLFHLTGLGQRQEHNYLKIAARQSGIKTATETGAINSFLVPKYCVGGELYIGLENAYPKDLVSLLIQVLEGTENTELDGFGFEEEIQWDVLCDNRWKNVQKEIVQNNTDNFLKSGIVKFPIPREATLDNTALPAGFIWLRASMGKKYNVVCKAIDIHVQATVATFEDRGNELSHLETGLEAGTIKKLITRIPKVKGVTQPYNSFGGYAKESDDRFYRRISERIRHKKRAVTLWDYEHLILQEFPEVFKVKCLNHTKIVKDGNKITPKYTSAGDVTIVAIPDIVNKNVFDPFEPRLSKATLNTVTTTINKLNSDHVTAEVINPDYEQVTIHLEASYYEGLDANFYDRKLNEDIIRLLSPWAYDNTQEVIFGIELHKSILVDYLEKLDYVDYVQHVYMKKGSEDQGNLVRPETPVSILVSVKQHIIKPVEKICGSNVNTKKPIECL